jgi:CelD/BcsL family acetyltransferase involved in cellulose biosynthesis
MVRNLRYYRDRAEKTGAMRITRASASNVKDYFDHLVRLHTSRWSARGEPGVLGSENVRSAHREALPALLAAGALRFYALSLDERVIAALYALSDPRQGGSTYCYLGSFDPEFESLSPGSAIIAHSIERALAEGSCSFDFLRGRERYKCLWGARECPTYYRELRIACAA